MNIELIPEEYASKFKDFINFRILVIGEGDVGKSWIIKREVENRFDKDIKTTRYLDFSYMYFIVNDHKIKLQIWDTMGIQISGSLFQGIYRNTSLFILVYDITKKVHLQT